MQTENIQRLITATQDINLIGRRILNLVSDRNVPGSIQEAIREQVGALSNTGSDILAAAKGFIEETTQTFGSLEDSVGKLKQDIDSNLPKN